MNQSNPFGAHLQPFSGIPSFMRLPVSRDLAGVDAAIVGVPFDSGTSFRPGARFGPRKIRELSVILWGYHNPFQLTPTERLKVVDYGDVEVAPPSIELTTENIAAEVGAILEAGPRVIALGGDHSISLPLLRAHHARYGPLAVIHLDSHPDTWESEFEGVRYSHGTPFRRALEEGLIAPGAYVQAGIRGSTSGPTDWQDARDLGARVITIDEALGMGIPALIQALRDTAATGGRPVYVSLDIDSLDPAYAPGTGTPEIGGFTSHQMLQLVRGLRGLDLVGFDLVEVSPPYDHGDITAIAAANLAFEFLALLADGKR
jgi:agmatinase/guanidinopropionase